MQVIDKTKSMYISPAVFTNIKLYNNFEEIPIRIDWDNFDIILLNERELDIDESDITIYVDLEYMNEQLILIKNMNENRFN